MKDAATLCIEGEFTIFQAMELKPALLPSTPLTTIDLSAVSEIDTAGVQLLMVAKMHAAANDCVLKLVGHSPAVLDVFELLNVAAFFGDPLVMDSPLKTKKGKA